MEQAPSRGAAAAGASNAPDAALPAAAWVAALVLVLLASLRAAWLLRDLSWLGPDTLPLLWATQARGPLASLGSPLFGELLPAPYYRPLLHASIALDHALHGLAPFGYQLSSIAVAALAGLALLPLARALGLSALGALVALAFLLLHPVWGVVLPVPARRADSLCLLFTLLALGAQLRASRADRRRAFAPALFCALAIGAKETGFAAAALCVVAAFLAPTQPGVGRRWQRALRALPPLLGVVVLGAALRWLVLGDLLGDRPIRESGFATAFPDMLGRVIVGSLSARAVWPDAPLPGAPLLLAAIALLGVLARCGREQRLRLTARLAPALRLTFAAWIVLATGYTLGVLLQPWYLLLPVAFAALGAGALAQTLADAAAAGSAALRASAWLGLLALGVALATPATDSYLLRGVGDWERADARARRYFEGLRAAIEAAPPGQRVAYASPPALIGPARPGGSEPMRGVVVLAPYTVEAWVLLHFPERSIPLVLGEAPRRAAAPPAAQPSFVVILADDLGYADLGFQGSREIATPRLDRLARESVRFSDAYVTSPLCAPTRAALLTGRDPNRYGYTSATGTFQHQVRHGVGVSLDETLLPELLRDSGYATAAIGKWHLGVRPEFRPLERGFQSFFGFLAGTHAYFDWGSGLYGPVFRDAEPTTGSEYLTDAFAREASEFIRAHAGEPYFLYVAFHAVHAPFEAPERHRAAYADASLQPEQRRSVAAMTSALDEAIGRILDAVEASGRGRETLVWFLNDNGGVVPISSNAPLRGGKGELFEGGIRVPALLRWPAELAPARYGLPVSILDVFPTVAAAAGLPDAPRPLDGVDLRPHLAGERGDPPHDVLRWRYDRQRAIRRGSWKWIEGEAGTALFDLARDPGETRDRSGELPERARALREDLDAWTRDLGAAPPAGSLGPPGSEVSQGP